MAILHWTNPQHASSLIVALFCAAALGCGASTPPPNKPAPAAETKADPPPPERLARGSATEALEGGGSVGAEYGGMNEEQVNREFNSAGDALATCLDEGSQGMPYLGGAINFYVEVDTSGHVVHAHVEKSDIGDREIAKCMLGVLREKRWPAPVGGKLGKILGGMTFSPMDRTNAPKDWEPDQVATPVGELSHEIEACKNGVAGSFTATAYIGTYINKSESSRRKAKDDPVEVGKIMAVGVTPPSKEGEEAVDCIVKVLRSGTFPSPGQIPAKVQFSL